MPDDVDLYSHLGQRLRDWRNEFGASQEDLSNLVRVEGINWTRPKIAQIESGKRRLTIDELLVLSFATGKPLKYWLDPGEGHLRISERLVFSSEAAVAIASSRKPKTVVYRPHEIGEVRLPPDAFKAFEFSFESSPEATQDIHTFTGYEAEMNAASRFGVDPASVVLASRALWGQSLTPERDARAKVWLSKHDDKRTIQAMRGHMSRVLLDELGGAFAAFKEKGYEL